MKLTLKRRFLGDSYTIGSLYIDGIYECDTIEDKVRPKGEKVYGQTAIPYGTYEIVMNIISAKFQNRSWAKPWYGKLPRLLNVPNFEGILIHVGNTAADSLGCILVGQNKVKGQVINSTICFNNLMKKLTQAKDRIFITIE